MLSIVFFIFNLFIKILYLIIISYFKQILYYYWDNFIAIFGANILAKRLEQEAKIYIWVTNLFVFLFNNSKNCKEIEIIVFGIEIDTFIFTV